MVGRLGGPFDGGVELIVTGLPSTSEYFFGVTLPSFGRLSVHISSTRSGWKKYPYLKIE